MASAEFVVNNKVHIATKILSFMANYKRELKIKKNIRKRGKVENTMEFVKRIKKVYKKTGVVLKKTQKDMKKQTNKRRKETKNWKKENRVMLSTKDLVFKKRPVINIIKL